MTVQFFSSFQQSIIDQQALKLKLWVVPLVNTSNIDLVSIQDYIVNPHTVPTLPDDMDLTTCILIDQAVPLSKLGTGVVALEVQVFDSFQWMQRPHTSHVPSGIGEIPMAMGVCSCGCCASRVGVVPSDYGTEYGLSKTFRVFGGAAQVKMPAHQPPAEPQRGRRTP